MGEGGSGRGTGGEGVGGWGRGLGRRGGQGTFHPPCHILHCHIVFRPKGTSHNNGSHNHESSAQFLGRHT